MSYSESLDHEDEIASATHPAQQVMESSVDEWNRGHRYSPGYTITQNSPPHPNFQGAHLQTDMIFYDNGFPGISQVSFQGATEPSASPNFDFQSWNALNSPSWSERLQEVSQSPFEGRSPANFPLGMSSRPNNLPLTVRTDVTLAPPGSPSSAYMSPSTSSTNRTLVEDRRASGSSSESRSPMSPETTHFAMIKGARDPQSPYIEQQRVWKSMQQRISGLVPQKMYKPQTSSDKRRYIDEIQFDAPIYFRSLESQGQEGILVYEALNGHLSTLENPDQEVFLNCGPSVSIRINWPGYESWSKQIPTKNWKTPPGPITRQKLAKQVARRIEDFIEHMKDQEMEEDDHCNWKVGPSGIALQDLVLVSLHHVSKGSWQPQLRIVRRS